MPQYTSTQTTTRGAVINAVLDTATNTITYTVTTPTGATATTTLPATEDGNKSTNLRSLIVQIEAQGPSTSLAGGFASAVARAGQDTKDQAGTAEVEARRSGNPPPAESAPIPVAAADNPNATPAPSVPPVENATPPVTEQTTVTNAAFLDANAEPQQLIDPNNDPNTNIGNATQTLDIPQPQQEITINSDPNTNIGEEIQNSAPATIGDEDAFEAARLEAEARNAQLDKQAALDAATFESPKGILTPLNDTRSTATKQDSANFQQKPDWRARLSLAPNANYLYKVPKGQAGILEPLQSTDGVIFPYTPGISVTYSAGYDASELIHSNYKVYQYKGSSVDTVSINADFTAQDTNEANYLLAVIHFFRSVTKMFYGQDQNPNNGVPPPLCYLSGFGAYTFDAHPLVVTNFTYTTPTEVDYIRAGSQTNQPGVNVALQNNIVNSFVPSVLRTAINGLAPKIPNFSTQNSLINSNATYVPTKIQLQITCIPIVTRNDISNKFSLKEYATGALLRGSKRSGGGIW